MELLDNTIEKRISKAYFIKIAIFYGILINLIEHCISFAMLYLDEYFGLFAQPTWSLNKLGTFQLIQDGLLLSYFAFKANQRYRQKTSDGKIMLLECISIVFIMSFVHQVIGILWSLMMRKIYFPDSTGSDTYYILQMMKGSGISFIIYGILVSIIICLLLRKPLFENNKNSSRIGR